MPKPKTLRTSDPAAEIIKRLEKCTGAGLRLSEVFDDWLDLTYASLQALPRHLTASIGANALTFVEDTPETQAVFRRVQARYDRYGRWEEYYWPLFVEAFQLLVVAAAEFDVNAAPSVYGPDVLGAVYSQTAYKPHSAQYFTPWSIAYMMAQMTMSTDDLYREVSQRLRAAFDKAIAQDDAQAILLQATTLVATGAPEEERLPFFAERILPIVGPYYDPVRILDPCVGSGIMLLAAAVLTPSWMRALGLVQFYGMDIDATCVKMAQCNAMLYGFSGPSETLFGTATIPADVLAGQPEPYRTAFALAQEAEALGDVEMAAEIAGGLRAQQQLFDPSEYVSALKRRPLSNRNGKQPKSAPDEPLAIPLALFDEV